MKRILSLLVCSLLLCGCTKMPEGQAGQTTQTVSTNPTASIPVDYSISGGGDIGPDIVFSDYEEYLNYFKDDTLIPINFVHYEQIASLGTFVRYECYNGIALSDPAQFNYTIKDEYGNVFRLTVYRSDFNHEEVKRVEDVSPGDLRWSSKADEHNRMFVADEADDFVYEYNKNGRLHHICWEVNGYGFSLWAENFFCNIEGPPASEGGSFLARMICLDTALIAQDEFVAMVSTPYTPEDDEVA